MRHTNYINTDVLFSYTLQHFTVQYFFPVITAADTLLFKYLLINYLNIVWKVPIEEIEGLIMKESRISPTTNSIKSH